MNCYNCSDTELHYSGRLKLYEFHTCGVAGLMSFSHLKNIVKVYNLLSKLRRTYVGFGWSIEDLDTCFFEKGSKDLPVKFKHKNRGYTVDGKTYSYRYGKKNQQ